jgi:alanyl-tRNA synthetase
MDSFLQKECDLQFFHKNGFMRKKCSSCGAHYWTLDKDSKLCGDQPCVEFSFIGKPIGKKPFSLSEIRESFLSFFEKNSHSRLSYPETGERCPVVARWRSDIYLTIASIADFQPHVTSGEVPPPANPLVISQPCIRLNDLEEVGVSGRHLTTFEMMGHHAFNKNIDEIYFKEETVRLCDEYFVNHIGIPRKSINYKEQLWAGGGNAGPCLEVIVDGLEIATLVFMNMKEDENGEFEIEGKKYSQNPLNIVDTGYGLERIAWCTQGTKTVYETTFPEMVKWLKEYAKNKSDLASIYSLADHTKCLAFMLGDGVVPSNVKAGYLARLIIRRSLRFLEKIELNASLRKLVEMQLDFLEKVFPSLKKRKKQIGEILDIETKKYSETISKGESLVKRILKEKKALDENELITLYDTHGMPPNIVKNIAKNQGVKVNIPKNFESIVAELHTHETKEEGAQETRSDLPSTEQLYYKDHYTREFDAKVLWTKGFKIILDKTAFYPEGGGQLADKGTLSKNGVKLSVKNVIKEGNTIIHVIDGNLDVGDKVHGVIDWNYRYTLMKHHTGTHVVNGALRKLLGEHIWQAGSQLGINEARFDFSHYKSISDSERKEIENLANQFIKKAIPVEKKVMDRNSAEKTFGFRLYQGGVPPGDSIRVLNIPDIDVEACGGTHLNNISEVEKIRIIKTERIQDGVNRVVFAAGKMADAYQEEENEIYDQIVKTISSSYEIKEKKNVSEQLKEVSKIFSVPIDQLDKTLKRFQKETRTKEKKTVKNLIEASKNLFEEWKKTRKTIKRSFSLNADLYREERIKTKDKEIKIIFEIVPRDKNPIKYAHEKTEQEGIIAYLISGNRVTLSASNDVNIDLGLIAQKVGEISGGSGGGKPNLAHATMKEPDKNYEAMEKTKELIKKKLEK